MTDDSDLGPNDEVEPSAEALLQERRSTDTTSSIFGYVAAGVSGAIIGTILSTLVATALMMLFAPDYGYSPIYRLQRILPALGVFTGAVGGLYYRSKHPTRRLLYPVTSTLALAVGLILLFLILDSVIFLNSRFAHQNFPKVAAIVLIPGGILTLWSWDKFYHGWLAPRSDTLPNSSRHVDDYISRRELLLSCGAVGVSIVGFNMASILIGRSEGNAVSSSDSVEANVTDEGYNPPEYYISGRVTNVSDNTLDISITALFYDENGARIGNRSTIHYSVRPNQGEHFRLSVGGRDKYSPTDAGDVETWELRVTAD